MNRKSLTLTGLFLTTFLLITINFFSSQNAESKSPNPLSLGFQIINNSQGTTLYQKDLDYVQTVNLSQGAKINFIYGNIRDLGTKKGAYGGNDPQFERQKISQVWSNLYSENSSLFCITNGQFFRNDKNTSTGLAFPVKSDGIIVSDGYAGEIEFPDEKLMLEVWKDRALITKFQPNNLQLSTAPNLIVGLQENADKGVEDKTGRTFIGIKDKDGDRLNETILIFTSKKATQPHAAQVLKSFGATQVIMLDGGGSTQLICQGNNYITSPRTIPQMIVIALRAGNRQQATGNRQ
ncbi:MAG: phosphodiester glycosidase family protein [Okeania sp. SIO2C2]|uniref:phosphodiester glycosidase family protein n=1 Tax=Okeania sp. SIO2C2 TaxID=2607787 RepID=UPI0013BDCD1F|nr:phosphodiester glycosidase family protein [Okeania sp. SIO2C2]NEP88257.1 phosphodiester glycosidase family protein [Okeania sp. SIO2C2]